MAQREALRDVLCVSTEAPTDTLADRLERLETRGLLRGVDADTLGRAVVDGSEDRDQAFVGRPDGRCV